MGNDLQSWKNTLDDKRHAVCAGRSCSALTQQVREIEKEYLKISVARAKAELLAFLLQNARITLHRSQIFACDIEHGDLMQRFQEALPQRVFKAEMRKLAPLENVVIASMDFGHIAPDWAYLLEKGIPGVLADLARYQKVFEEDPEKAAYYSQRITVYTGLQEYCLRYAALADSLHTEKGEFVAANMRALAGAAPRTLAQAMQLILLFYVVQSEMDGVRIRSLGGLDRLLQPFFENDLKQGTFSRQQLSRITKYFLYTLSGMKVTANTPFYICGMDENGNDATNEFTQFLLQAYSELDIYDPKIHVMYHENMDQQVLRQILALIRAGKNSFVFMNTELASKSLEMLGVSREDAKKVIVYGCYETAAEGTEIPCTCGGKVNLVKALEYAIHNGVDTVSGQQVSIRTGWGFGSFAQFYEAVIQQLEHCAVACMDAMTAYEPYYHEVCPSMLLSPTFRNSREQGIDVYSGGAKYNNTSIVGVGLATLVDSLIAVKKAVFEEKRITLEEFRNILLSDWRQNERLRLIVKKKYPKFGNNIDEADQLAVDLYSRFSAFINGRRNGRGGVFRCGMFSVDWRFPLGETTGATPDGRRTGEPLSKNLAASAGQDKNGVTAYLNSLLKLDGTQVPDGYVADVVLHASAARGEEGMLALTGPLTAFMKKGGFSVHFNILSPETLIHAQKEPEKYQNLQIRLCGWNVRFVDLDKGQQDEFIKQSENTL